MFPIINTEHQHGSTSLSLRPHFLDFNPKPSFNDAILTGLLFVLQNTPKPTPITFNSPSNFLGTMFVTNRVEMENDPLNPSFPLIASVIALLNERTARTRFRKGLINGLYLARSANDAWPETLEISRDLMFTLPGISPAFRSFSAK
ncbi:hypothetical protein R3P38DRAFT_3189684 [Favolaschia claudopus]|uniref:Uncharacterized protein n=1 Tax=Favolaschia claudopus TaxID=2862362 RepID=A0AAW0BRX4_9AGAR